MKYLQNHAEISTLSRLSSPPVNVKLMSFFWIKSWAMEIHSSRGTAFIVKALQRDLPVNDPTSRIVVDPIVPNLQIYVSNLLFLLTSSFCNSYQKYG